MYSKLKQLMIDRLKENNNRCGIKMSLWKLSVNSISKWCLPSSKEFKT